MKPLYIVLILLAGLGSARGAVYDPSLGEARQAQALLGPDSWSEVLSIENTGSQSRFPRHLHALVFELEGILWFYAPDNGTQSLSRERGRAVADERNLGPLLKEVERGFASWSVVPPDPASEAARGVLPNGCFILSVAAFRERAAAGNGTAHAQLLSFYWEGAGGHTVLVYETAGGVCVLDPVRSSTPARFPAALARDALALARRLDRGRITRALWLPLHAPARVAPGYATVAERRRPAPAGTAGAS